MDELAARRVAVDLSGERENAVAVDVEADQCVGAALAGEDVLQLAGGNGDRHGVGAEAVDDRRDFALTAQAARRTGPQRLARFGGEGDVGHGEGGLSGASRSPPFWSTDDARTKPA